MDNMSHISLSLVGSKWGQIQHSHCFVLQRKLNYSIKYVVHEIRRQFAKCIHVFIRKNTILNKKNIGKGSHTVTILEKRSSSCHKEVRRITCRQRTGKFLLPNAKRFKL